ERLAFLIGGAAATVFCFYAAQNVYYRAIFILFTLPGLWQLTRGPDATRARGMLAVLFLLLWEAIPRDLLAASGYATGFWLMREILWWWLVIQLGALLLAFTRHEAGRLIRAARTQN
ncbi:MAG TPA: hypothetical protein PLY97_10800, partial [Acidocella sp.]|nr:hypothetical protein [Acidocella sp.]